MAKSVEDAVLDAAWLEVANNCSEMTICETEPTSYSQASQEKGTGDGKVLARVNMAGGDFNRGAGTPDGRQQQVAAKAGITVLQSGDADHVALIDATSRLLYVTTATSQPVTSGNTIGTNQWITTIRAPT